MIVIFGGAFNPPTLAHLEIYHHVQKNLAPERFIFLPVSSLYTKRSLASNQHRFQMLKIMTSGIANIDVS
ncbi:MAG: nicotinate (nicotinamide) nucleotide adenylyltransferase, partial [Bacilli bacterium]|nr:nicotinate (nicotinamide) nucleotide adenylyltransferase [Bacilli bacterium]